MEHEAFVDKVNPLSYYLLNLKAVTTEGAETLSTKFSPFYLLAPTNNQEVNLDKLKKDPGSLTFSFRTNPFFKTWDYLEKYQLVIQKKTLDPKTKTEITDYEDILVDNIPPQ